MKFTVSWLKEYLETDANVDEIVDAMTLAGLEVEEVVDPSKTLEAFTTAKIVEIKQHPDADKLQVCQVDTVDGKLEIVCGGLNARVGLVTVFAPIGAYVPGAGFTLVPKPVRGIISNVMLCSGGELEADEDPFGLFIKRKKDWLARAKALDISEKGCPLPRRHSRTAEQDKDRRTSIKNFGLG